MFPMITVTILTKNSAQYLFDVLDALKSFDEVLLLDSGSTDDTFAIAKKFPNVSIHKSATFDGFGPMHNKAVALARHDWILSIDSDEIVTPELSKEILNLRLDPSEVYSLSRRNYYNGKWIKWCGWHPDRAYRMFNRKRTRFNDAQVHESVIVKDMKVVCLQNPMTHYSYASTSDFLRKMQHYSALFAEQNRGKRESSTCKAVLHGVMAFFKSYILKRGIMGGREGFIISVYNANTTFYKYLKLAELNKLPQDAS